MPLFRKKPPDDGESGERSSFAPQPEKARKWFDHARTSADSSNFEYALTCYASGIKLNPTLMSAHEEMLESAVKYVNSGGKPASGKEVRRLDDGSAVGRFAAAEFEWMKDLTNHKASLKTLQAAVKAEQLEFGNWIAPRVLNLLRNQKKFSKATLLQAMELFRDVGAWDESMAAGEMARQLDPTDNELANTLKNLSAQRAMDQGGYEQVGEEGGFRKFIKDARSQQELLEGESLAAGASIDERNLERARRAYEETPSAPDAVNRFAQLLRKQATPEAEVHAEEIYLRAFRDSGEYRFRMNASDIRIARLERRLCGLEEEEAPARAAEREQVRAELLELKAKEYEERTVKYPTDRFRRYALGEVQFELGRYQQAMAQFQKSKDEPKLRVRAGHLLGRCFLEERWYSEAIGEFREALEAIDATEKDRELAIRYDLMVALLENARQEQSIDLAKQARTICSEIARLDITYRDIRAKRGEADEVVKALGGTEG